MANNDVKVRVSASDMTAAAWKSVKKGAAAASRGIGKAFKAIRKAAKLSAPAIRGVGKAFKGIARAGRRSAKIVSVAFLAVGAAIVIAMKRAQEFNKQIAQVATLADINMREAKKAVRGLSVEFGLAKDELTKGLYDALSAGVPKENVFEFMRVASKAAIAGAATTAETVDILTTALNAFKIPASEAQSVSDALFTTVRLGKTTMTELAQSFAQVGPIASASGVKIEELLAGVATLTKQGTPTAQAMTQIRGAIIAMNRELGDGWTATMTLQEGMQAMSDKAGGSNVKLKELTGRVEGMLAILGITGKNAKGAADDLNQLTGSAGALDAAFEKMKGKNPLDRAQQGFDNMVRTAGHAAILAFGGVLNDIATAAGRAGEAIANWTQTENFAAIKRRVEELTESARNFVKMMNNPIGRTKSVKKLANVIGLAFEVGAKKAGNTLINGLLVAWDKFNELAIQGFKKYGKMLIHPLFAAATVAKALATPKGERVKGDFLGAGEASKDFKDAATDLSEYVAIVNDLEIDETAGKLDAKVDPSSTKTPAEIAADAVLTEEKRIAEVQAAAAAAEEIAGAKRLAIAAKIKAANEQIAGAERAERGRDERDRIGEADDAISEAQRKVALLARNSDQRREDAKAARKEAFDARKGRAAQDKRRDGSAMSRNEKLLADLADQRDKMQIAENLKKVAEGNLKQLAQDDRQNQINQLKVAIEARDLLKKNLQAAGG